MKVINIEEHSLKSKSAVRFQKLTYYIDDPGRTTQEHVEEIQARSDSGYWFVNPMFLVRSSKLDMDFVSRAEKCRSAWYRILCRQYKKGWRIMRRLQSSELQRGYDFDGVIVAKSQAINANSFRRDWIEFNSNFLTISKRPKAIEALNKHDMRLVEKVFYQELVQYQSIQKKDTASLIFVLPHITLSVNSEDNIPSASEMFDAEVRSITSAWQHTLKRKLPREIFHCLGDDLRQGCLNPHRSMNERHLS